MTESELRALLVAWDPVGSVAAGGPVDEYDCLIDPVLQLVVAGCGPGELAAYLARELREHFGLDPVVQQDALDAFVGRVLGARDVPRWP